MLNLSLTIIKCTYTHFTKTGMRFMIIYDSLSRLFSHVIVKFVKSFVSSSLKMLHRDVVFPACGTLSLSKPVTNPRLQCHPRCDTQEDVIQHRKQCAWAGPCGTWSVPNEIYHCNTVETTVVGLLPGFACYSSFIAGQFTLLLSFAVSA